MHLVDWKVCDAPSLYPHPSYTSGCDRGSRFFFLLSHYLPAYQVSPSPSTDIKIHTQITHIHLFHTYICLYICLPNRFCPSANLTIKMSCSTFKHLVLESEAFINTVGRQWHSVTHPADNPSWEDRGYLQTMVFPRVVPVRHHSVQRLVFNHLTHPVSHTHALPTTTTLFPVFLLPEEQNLRVWRQEPDLPSVHSLNSPTMWNIVLLHGLRPCTAVPLPSRPLPIHLVIHTLLSRRECHEKTRQTVS